MTILRLQNKKSIAAIVLLLILSAVCARLGFWQLDRAEQRLAISAEIEAGHQQPALNLIPAPLSVHNWQTAYATGFWRPDLTVLLENRNHQGQPGYWLSTPLILNSETHDALLVLRGWFKRDTPTPQLEDNKESVHVQGELRSHVPRMYELANLWGPAAQTLPAQLPTADAQPPVLQNLELTALQHATGLQLRPYVLMLHESTPSENPNLIQAWPQPNLDAHQNRGYALQWFSFATIAGTAALFLLWRRRRLTPTSDHTNDA